jgi:transcription initiation factor TFIID TATA-box-binding protein
LSLSVISKISINVENVVATTFLNQELNLKKIIKAFSQCKYDPTKFPGAVIRQENPRCVILIFKSGSIVCTGTKSIDNAELAIKRFVLKLEKISKSKSLLTSEIKIENMVASCNLQDKIHLEQAARKLPRSMYEPEQFPGIIHRHSHPNTVLLIFASGRLVCTGAKSNEDIRISVNSLKLDLERLNLMSYQF